MTVLSDNQLVDLVVGWVKQNSQASGSLGVEITEDTDLISSGLLDSFGFVDLIMFLETQGRCIVDLTEADPDEFSVVKGLCRIALRSHH